MNILFICRHNRFRSRFAEAYFKKINKDSSIKIKSSGVLPGTYPLDEIEVEEAKKLGINIEGKPQATTTELLRWADIIIVVANDIPAKELFNYKFIKNKPIVWEIEDRYLGGRDKINETYKEIMEDVDKFNEKLKQGKLKWKQ